jgi:hypothetical protein
VAVTNVELETGAMNDADTLTRFEFFEMLVRVSLFKYEADKMRPGPAVSRLYHECIVDHVTDRALLDNDYFRYTCLYTQPVGRVLHRFEDKLRRVRGGELRGGKSRALIDCLTRDTSLEDQVFDRLMLTGGYVMCPSIGVPGLQHWEGQG